VGCCGKTISKIVNIVEGNISLLAENLFKLEILKCVDTDTRTRICQQCEKSTWLTKAEYMAYLNQHKVEAVKNIADLSVLPELPKAEYDKGKKLFCQICKCFIPAKVRVDKEQCPIGKWATAKN